MNQAEVDHKFQRGKLEFYTFYLVLQSGIELGWNGLAQLKPNSAKDDLANE